MADTDTLRALLVRAADPPGPPPFVSGATLVARARRRRRRQWAGRGGALLATGVASVLLVTLLLPGSTPAPAPALTTASRLAAGTWTELPAAPIAGRVDPSAVWTGTQMLVWGGQGARDGGPVLVDDGASFDPGDGTWDVLPAGPITPRTGAASVWTGTEWFLWGGVTDTRYLVGGPVAYSDTGALYNPAARRWRTTAKSPLPPQTQAQAHWTGSSIVVVPRVMTASGQRPTAPDMASYDPVSDTWTRLPELPRRDRETLVKLSSAVGDGKLFVWAMYDDPQALPVVTTPPLADLHVLDLTSNQWAAPVTWPFRANIGDPVWTGSALLMPADGNRLPDPDDYGTAGSGPEPANVTDEADQRGALFDPERQVFSAIARGPVDGTRPINTWAGAALVSLNTLTTVETVDTSTAGSTARSVVEAPGEGAVWDYATDRWTALPMAPMTGSGAVQIWTGRELLMWGPMTDTNAEDAAPPEIGTKGFRIGG